jgi:hypothetical protein
VRDGRLVQLILYSDKEKYFSQSGLTRFLKISPSGKSPGSTEIERCGLALRRYLGVDALCHRLQRPVA